ncbi:hypothetical protein BKA57DRAFT_469213 [Linnemannia elongata]|nr:hypothetical protein BKA57DRAFT_469213 [Linnemannia elongata]
MHKKTFSHSPSTPTFSSLLSPLCIKGRFYLQRPLVRLALTAEPSPNAMYMRRVSFTLHPVTFSNFLLTCLVGGFACVLLLFIRDELPYMTNEWTKSHRVIGVMTLNTHHPFFSSSQPFPLSFPPPSLFNLFVFSLVLST